MDYSGYNREKERAARVVYEIVRQNEGEFHNKTKLFKVFWKSHLLFHQATGNYLTGWPIVKMPNGPGIGDFDVILGQLLQDGLVTVSEVQRDEGTSFVFRIVDHVSPPFDLHADEIEAITKASEEVTRQPDEGANGKASRVWSEAKEGEELNIYLDLIADEERDRLMESIGDTASVLFGVKK